MKFYLDENMNYGCLAPLQQLYIGHEFHHASDENLTGEKDIPLFTQLQKRKYNAILTKDRNQLVSTDERRALFDSGLHWIGHVAKGFKGLMGLTTETATVTAGLIYVIEDWRPEPHWYQLKGIPTDVGQRVKVRAVGLDGWRRSSRSSRGAA